HIKVAVDDGPGERHVERTLLAERAPLPCIFLDAIPRRVRTGGVMIVEVAQRRRAGVVEPLLYPREVAHARRMRRSFGGGQMPVRTGMTCVFAYVNANSIACDGGG